MGESRATDFLATSGGWAVLASAGAIPAGAALLSPAVGALACALLATVLVGWWLAR